MHKGRSLSPRLAHSPSRDLCSLRWRSVSGLLSPSSSVVGVGAPPSADRQKWSHMSEDTLTLLNMRVSDTAVCYPGILAECAGFFSCRSSLEHSRRVKL
ncbi:hypothetical protein QQF64_030920 [Cirrhinus molitorella]|uniref:Uncharacterized protein n=1 Tax=Cirrhinus molitorella TaxID=172907 RepID=A0ABR3N4P6_9TELE